jgi:hypothetical protein
MGPRTTARGIDADHSHMVKYASRQDANYQKLLAAVEQILDDRRVS